MLRASRDVRVAGDHDVRLAAASPFYSPTLKRTDLRVGIGGGDGPLQLFEHSIQRAETKAAQPRAKTDGELAGPAGAPDQERSELLEWVKSFGIAVLLFCSSRR